MKRETTDVAVVRDAAVAGDAAESQIGQKSLLSHTELPPDPATGLNSDRETGGDK